MNIEAFLLDAVFATSFLWMVNQYYKKNTLRQISEHTKFSIEG